MPDDPALFTLNLQATAQRPLLGLTVLLVEDSRFASEAVRLMCIRSGARIRRADTLAHARRHLQVYRPSVLIVDLGLPDGSGLELIQSLSELDDAARPVILATSGADGTGQEQAARDAGANGFLTKPVSSVSAFQQAILEHLPPEMQPTGPRLVSRDTISPDMLALNEDLSHLDHLLGTGRDTLPYVAPFLQGLARLAGDKKLKAVSDKLSGAIKRGSGIGEAIEATREVIRAKLAKAELV